MSYRRNADAFIADIKAAMVLSRAGLAEDPIPVQFERSHLVVGLPAFPRRKPRLLGGWNMGRVLEIINLMCRKATITTPSPAPANDPNGYKRMTLNHDGEPSAHEVIEANERVAAALAKCGLCPASIAEKTALKDS